MRTYQDTKRMSRLLLVIFATATLAGRLCAKELGQPINLGRTSLAAVTASSVNGNRAIDNRFYGVVNAFDGGANRIKDINYTYWMPDNEPSSWVEVTFDAPVTVTAIYADGSPPFTATLTLQDGQTRTLTVKRDEPPPAPSANQTRSGGILAVDGSAPRTEVSREAAPSAPLAGVTRVRLRFEPPSGKGADLMRVNEIRIMGFLPAGSAPLKEQRPRVLVTKRTAELKARELFDQWKAALTVGAAPAVTEDESHIVLTYRKDGKDLFRVTINKGDGSVSAEPLAVLQSRSGAGADDRPATERPPVVHRRTKAKNRER
jgi:hypothetical protein